MTHYPTPNASGIIESMEYANTVSDSFYGIGILFVLYAIVFLTLQGKGETAPRSAGTASFLTVITAILLYVPGVIGEFELAVTALILGIVTVWIYYNR